MHTERVYTNETCNQNCGFCNARQPRERRAFVGAAAVRERIDSALDGDPSTVILTGGEPTLRRDLASLVRHAKSRGRARVVLETNAALIDESRARELADAGLDAARVHLPGWRADYDRITRDPGGFEAAVRGMFALAAASIPLEASSTVSRETAEGLPLLPARIRESALPVTTLLLCPVLDAPRADSLLPLPEMAELIERTQREARLNDLDLRLDPHTFVPPCLFRHPGRMSHLFSMTRGGSERPGYARVQGCAECVVEERCPGLPMSRRDGVEVRPLSEDRLRRKLSVISTVQEQITRELVQDEIERQPEGENVPTRIVRINFRCNQACHFCFVSTHLPSATEDAVREAIVGIARRRGILVISGGEPTLNPRLAEYIRLGWAEGAARIELQTNAIRLRDPELTAQIADAGVTFAFVSLHGSRADIADVVTAAPGTFDQQVLGIDQAVRHDIPVRLNFVFNEHNREDFPTYVDMVARRWPTAGITVSFVAPSSDVVPRTPELVPRYSDVLPFLSEGLRRAERNGVRVSGFESMCGIPLCLVPSDVSAHFELTDIPGGTDESEFVHAEACGRCELRSKCFGVRRGYAELHGTDEFEPVFRAG